MYYITDFGALKRKNDESMSDFIKRINKFYNRIPSKIKPSQTSAKITYDNAFDVDLSLLLREGRYVTLTNIQDFFLKWKLIYF